MSSEKTPLISSGPPPSSLSGGAAATSSDSPAVHYFLERTNSNVSQFNNNNNTNTDAEEVDTLPEGSIPEQFQPRPVSVSGDVAVGSLAGSSKSPRGSSKKNWFNFFKNIRRKSNAFAATGGTTAVIDSYPRSAPVKIDPKVFFANERTFLAWMHVSVILAGASVAIVAFTDADTQSVPHQLYGVILLPVSIAFILYAMTQYSRRASMIRRKAPGPYVDIAGPTVFDSYSYVIHCNSVQYQAIHINVILSGCYFDFGLDMLIDSGRAYPVVQSRF